MKKIFLVLLLALVKLSFGQSYKISDISGAYHLEDGAALFITENHKAYIVAMGTLLMGDVSIQGKQVNINFPTPDQPFSVFGRYRNEKEKGGFVMMFNFNENQYINYNSENEKFTSMDRIFNVGSNCWDYPYVFEEKNTNATKIYLAEEENPTEVLEFDNQERFNDFIVIHYEKPEISHLNFEISKDKKSLKERSNNRIIQKHKLDNEEKEFITNLDSTSKKTDASNAFFYTNPAYNDFSDDHLEKGSALDLKDYTKKQKGREYYFLNGEDIKTNDFHDTNIIYEYKKLPVKKWKNKNYKVNQKSLLHYSCVDKK